MKLSAIALAVSAAALAAYGAYRMFRCAHAPITERGAGKVTEKCFVCGKVLTTGWDFNDLPKPRPLPREPRRSLWRVS